jgi:ATP-dependent exoDNAse (exonuclease V) beta subunit
MPQDGFDKIQNSFFIKSSYIEHESAEQKYGIIAHKIIEDIFKCKDTSIIDSHYLFSELEPNIQLKLRVSLKNLFNLNEVQDWLEHKLQQEQEVIMKHGDSLYIGRIDLLVIKPDEVIIVDYKTDQNPPLNVVNVNKKYMEQISRYVEVVKSIYPDKVVSSYFVWLETTKLMKI